jgi:hypothetical protein
MNVSRARIKRLAPFTIGASRMGRGQKVVDTYFWAGPPAPKVDRWDNNLFAGSLRWRGERSSAMAGAG